MKKIKLAPDLEKALLRAISEGVCSSEIVEPEELSKEARQVYESIRYLFKKKTPAPLRPASIFLTAQSLFGVDKEEFKAYLSSFKDLGVGKEISSILRTARDKTLLVQLINEAGSQLSQGHLDPATISRLLAKESYGTAIRALAGEVGNKFPVVPSGLPLRGLPCISKAANGLIGIWIIGGEPGLGKSTLALQLALEVGQDFPAVYYDLDGTGREWTIERIRRVSQDNIKLFRQLTTHFYYRENISTLDEDLSFLRREYANKPALLVIDSLQKLPTSVKYYKESMDSWIRRFTEMTKQGIRFVCVSEQNRAHYGQATMSGYKGSGDIEYAGTFCVQLTQPEDADDEDDPIWFEVVKNRHNKRIKGETFGHIVDLVRDSKKEFWFTEETPSD